MTDRFIYKGGFMKKIIGIFSAIAGIAVLAGVCYFVYKHFFCCCEAEECECEGESCETKAAPHSRGYFNLRRIKEAAEESKAAGESRVSEEEREFIKELFSK